MSDSIRDHPAARAFVSTAQRFCALMEGGVRDKDMWLADVLATLATLYAAGPVLREVTEGLSESGNNIPQDFRLSNDEWTVLYQHLRAVLGEDAAYSSHFNPVKADAAKDEMGMGDLADDFADIYRDIKPGVTAWNTEDDSFLDDVIFQWVHYGLAHHWGRHAVDALRTLHWLVYNKRFN